MFFLICLIKLTDKLKGLKVKKFTENYYVNLLDYTSVGF